MRRQTGPGVAGEGGLVPTMGARGPFRVGEQVEIRVTNAAPTVGGLLTITLMADELHPFEGEGMHQANIQRIHTQVPVRTAGSVGVPGSGEWTWGFTVPAYKAGKTYRHKIELYDPAAPMGVAKSNVMYITYGP
jgi:hypothetical protein